LAIIIRIYSASDLAAKSVRYIALRTITHNPHHAACRRAGLHAADKMLRPHASREERFAFAR